MTLEVRRTLTRVEEFATAGTPGTPRGPPPLDAKEAPVINTRGRPVVAIRPPRVLGTPKATGNLSSGRPVSPALGTGKNGGWRAQTVDAYPGSARRKSGRAPTRACGARGAGSPWQDGRQRRTQFSVWSDCRRGNRAGPGTSISLRRYPPASFAGECGGVAPRDVREAGAPLLPRVPPAERC